MVRPDGLSGDRLERFRENYERDRESSATLEDLLRSAGRFTQDSAVHEKAAFGIDTFLRKEPFVDGSSWLEYQTWEFAVAQERFLLKKFAAGLADIKPQTSVGDTWDEVRAGLLSARGPISPSLFVIAGPVPQAVQDNIYKANGPWELAGTIGQRPFVIGALVDIPVLSVPGDGTTRGYVVDLRAFAHLRQFAPSRVGELVDITIAPIDTARAWELVQANRAIWNSNESGPKSDFEWWSSVHDRVEVHIHEAFELQVMVPQAAAAITIGE